MPRSRWLLLAWWVILKQVGLRLGRGFDHIPGVRQDRGPARGSRRLRAQLLSLCDGGEMHGLFCKGKRKQAAR